MNNTRFLAAHVLVKVMQGASLADCLPAALAATATPQDKALLQMLCFGVCRFYTRLEWILNHLLDKPMKAKNDDIKAFILIGLYQLSELNIPAHAAVSETLNAVAATKKIWAKSIVNAILRSYLRQREQIEQSYKQNAVAHYAHPEWWIAAIKQNWPDEWQSILTANNEHPPFVLRVNLNKFSRDNYIDLLKHDEVQATTLKFAPSAIKLTQAIPVTALPHFSSGDISVQDGAAQLAAPLLELDEQSNVLDACAAPGGKLIHLLEHQSQLNNVVAVEKEKSRMFLIHENLKRCGLLDKVTCHTSNVMDIEEWWDGAQFNRILLDVPCSASGVIRRHPDIKLLRIADDLTNLATLQLALLEKIWPLLQVGGILLYATCSIFSEENENVIAEFLSNHADAHEKKLVVDWGIARTHGRQILPGTEDMDGFYYAKLVKI